MSQRVRKMKKLKYKLIAWIANGDPVLMNFCVLTANIPQGMTIVYIPDDTEKRSLKYYRGKTFLVPTKNIDD